MKYMECSRLPGEYKNQPMGYVRILHASPGTGPIDVYANGELIAENITYTQTAGYFTVKPCSYILTVYTAGKRNSMLSEASILAEACLEVCPDSAVTVAVICTEPEVCMLAIPEVLGVSRQNSGALCRATLRFVHLSPNAPPVDVITFDGAKLFRNVPFKAHTRYRAIEAGKRMFRIVPSGSNQTGVTTPEYVFEKGTAYSLYAVGLAGGEPPLSAILTADNVY